MHRARRKVYSCQKQRLFTIRDGVIVALPEKNSKVSESNINDDSEVRSKMDDTSQGKTSKLSVEEIRKLRKFENYEKGPVSEVIFRFPAISTVIERDDRYE